jgi:hypothetical protein
MIEIYHKLYQDLIYRQSKIKTINNSFQRDQDLNKDKKELHFKVLAKIKFIITIIQKYILIHYLEFQRVK